MKEKKQSKTANSGSIYLLQLGFVLATSSIETCDEPRNIAGSARRSASSFERLVRTLN